MTGIMLIVIAISLTIMVLWKRLMLFVLGAVGFWIAVLAYYLSTLSSSPMLEQVILGIAAIVGGLLLYGMVGRQPSETLDPDGGSIRRFIRRLNGESVNSPRSHRETAEEYRGNVHRALHPNRVPKR